jgi:hypothetical protein
LQDVGQFGDEGRQNRMLANCDVFISMRGVSDVSATFFSNRLGSVRAATATNALDVHGRWTPTISHEERLSLGRREIMYPPVGAYGAVVQIRSASAHPFLVILD